MNKQAMIDLLKSKVDMWAYDRGHSAGMEEVDMLREEYLHDLEDIFKAIAEY